MTRTIIITIAFLAVAAAAILQTVRLDRAMHSNELLQARAAESDMQSQNAYRDVQVAADRSKTITAEAEHRAATAVGDSTRIAGELAICKRDLAAAIELLQQHSQTKPTAAAKNLIATIDKSPEMQAQRGALIAKAQAEGYFGELLSAGGRGVVQMEVTSKFMDLPFADKDLLAQLLYAQYFDGTDRLAVVNLVDDKHHKDVGNYSALRGGLNME